MPLSNTGSKVLEAMKKKYGKRGKSVFYATARKRNMSKWFASKAAKRKHT